MDYSIKIHCADHPCCWRYRLPAHRPCRPAGDVVVHRATIAPATVTDAVLSTLEVVDAACVQDRPTRRRFHICALYAELTYRRDIPVQVTEDPAIVRMGDHIRDHLASTQHRDGRVTYTGPRSALALMAHTLATVLEGTSGKQDPAALAERACADRLLAGAMTANGWCTAYVATDDAQDSQPPTPPDASGRRADQVGHPDQAPERLHQDVITQGLEADALVPGEQPPARVGE